MQIERGTGAGTADRIEDGGGGDLFAAFQADDDLLSGRSLDGDDLFVESSTTPMLRMIPQRLDGFLVDKSNSRGRRSIRVT